MKVTLEHFLVDRMVGATDAAKKREDVVPLYSVAIILGQCGSLNVADSFWPEFNSLISTRWSKSALEYIKKKAWEHVYP